MGVFSFCDLLTILAFFPQSFDEINASTANFWRNLFSFASDCRNGFFMEFVEILDIFIQQMDKIRDISPWPINSNCYLFHFDEISIFFPVLFIEILDYLCILLTKFATFFSDFSFWGFPTNFVFPFRDRLTKLSFLWRNSRFPSTIFR